MSPASPAGLTPDMQALVLEAEPEVKALVAKLAKMFRWVAINDVTQTVWEGYAEVAPRHDPAKGKLGAFGYKHAYGKAVEAFMREAHQAPLHLARRAFGEIMEDLRIADDPFVEDDVILAPIKAVCREGTFRMFFGATFETWRMQGEQGLVDHLTRLKTFAALQSAFMTLEPEEWKLLQLYYIECQTWAEVGEALGVGERQAKRRAEEIRDKLKRELLVRRVKNAPPEAG